MKRKKAMIPRRKSTGKLLPSECIFCKKESKYKKKSKTIKRSSGYAKNFVLIRVSIQQHKREKTDMLALLADELRKENTITVVTLNILALIIKIQLKLK